MHYRVIERYLLTKIKAIKMHIVLKTNFAKNHDI